MISSSTCNELALYPMELQTADPSTDRRTIGVFQAKGYPKPEQLLDALSSLACVHFVPLDELKPGRCDAAILFGVSTDQAVEAGSRGLRSLAFIAGPTQPIIATQSEIELSSSAYLNECLRGRKMSDKAVNQITLLKQEPHDDVMARSGDRPLWIYRRTGGAAVDLVAMQPPQLSDEEHLFRRFRKDDWARFLPLLHFTREIAGWQQPPVRACFMFDDPNLHWKSYGYIRYDQLIQHAHWHNYHAAFATIPIDHWYVHQETTALFRQNPSRVSLVIHGNNHTYFELARSRTGTSRIALAAQALRRTEALERATGLRVGRIMAAPHEACIPEMATVLVRTAFEMACISTCSLMVRNPTAAWPVTLGLTPAEFFGDGLPVLTRFNMRWDSTCALFAAYLGQPIILTGHHDDLASGLDLLEQWASLINSMGAVQWSDAPSIARANFCTRRAGDILHVKMYARNIRVDVPPGCTQLCIQRPWLKKNRQEDLAFKRGIVAENISSYEGQSLAVEPGDKVIISSVYPNPVDISKVPAPRLNPWAIARRQVCEGRDRLRPLIDRLRTKRSQTPLTSRADLPSYVREREISGPRASGFRIALLTAGRDKPYGLGLTTALTATGIDVDFIGGDEFRTPELLNNPQVNFLNLRGDQGPATTVRRVVRVLRYYSRLIRYAATAHPRTFHILWNNRFEVFDRTLLMLYYRLLGKRLAFTAHNVNVGKRDGKDCMLNRLSLRIQYVLSHHIFVHTRSMQRELTAEFGVAESKVTVVPFGINNTVPNTSLTSAEARHQLGLSSDEKTLLFFGNIAPYKGLDYLIAALTELSGACKELRLIIAGQPKGCVSYWNDIQQEIADRGLSDRIIRRIEYVPDEHTEIYFKAADVLVLPYTHVFQSGVLFLGYGFGLPVIASDVGSLREDIVEGQTGFVCRPKDAKDLAKTIREYFESDLYRSLESRRQDIQSFANERYSWDEVGRLTRKVYEELAEG